MQLKNKIFSNFEQHPFHLANPSPWPLYTSVFVFKSLFSILLFFQIYLYSNTYTFLSFIFLIYLISNWFGDIITESTLQGNHTKKVQHGLKMGMVFFICSEIMFFFSFFWGFFHFALAPSIWVGGIWPPMGLKTVFFLDLPVLNTLLLLSSGVSLTWCHRIFLFGELKNSKISLAITIFLGVFFTYLQYLEYNGTLFSMSDSVFGSTFYILTGFHGFHVILGFSILLVCLIRLSLKELFTNQHVGLECGIWYWHFVDLVWIFLYFIIYLWGC